jgi:hypothetical protein
VTAPPPPPDGPSVSVYIKEWATSYDYVGHHPVVGSAQIRELGVDALIEEMRERLDAARAEVWKAGAEAMQRQCDRGVAALLDHYQGGGNTNDGGRGAIFPSTAREIAATTPVQCGDEPELERRIADALTAARAEAIRECARLVEWHARKWKGSFDEQAVLDIVSDIEDLLASEPARADDKAEGASETPCPPDAAIVLCGFPAAMGACKHLLPCPIHAATTTKQGDGR